MLLQNYSEWGFLKPHLEASLSNPLGFEQAHYLALQLPSLVKQTTFRQSIIELNPINITSIPVTHLPWAKLVFAMLAQGFVWCNGEEDKTNFLPKSIAMPLVAISNHLHEPPILNYADYILRNTQLKKPVIDQKIPFKPIYTFTDLDSESGFILSHVIFELKGREALRLGLTINQAIEHNDIEAIHVALKTLEHIIFELIEAFNTVHVTTSEKDFRDHFRIFLKGWNNIIPQMTYHHVNIQAQELRGETGAQSSLLPFLDSIVGVGKKLIEFSPIYGAWRPYMPEIDRQFLSTVDSLGLRLRNIVAIQHDLIPAYNAILTRLISFRKNHLATIKSYIEGNNQDLSHAVGTGGSFYSNYLGGLISCLESLKF